MTTSDYKLIRSKRKTMALEVALDGSVTVRIPLKCSEREVESFIELHKVWIAKAKLKQQKRAANRPKEPTNEEITALKQKANALIPLRVRYFEELTGLKASSVKITSAKARLGSCSAKNGLCFSYRLMLYPDSAIDYVIVHELCHTVHHNHSRQFWNLVAKIMPDFKNRQQLLR